MDFNVDLVLAITKAIIEVADSSGGSEAASSTLEKEGKIFQRKTIFFQQCHRGTHQVAPLQPLDQQYSKALA